MAAAGSGAVRLTGELDINSVQDISRQISQAVAGMSGGRLAVNMAEVTFMDSSAIGALVAQQAAAGTAGVELVVVDASDPVRRVLEITGLAELFRLADESQPRTESA